MLSGLNSFSNNLGTLLGLCLSLVVPVQYYTFPLCCPSVIFLFLWWQLPESPVWLMRNDKEKEARQTLAWLRGHSYDIEPEVEELKKIVAQEVNGPGSSIINVLTNKSFLKPLFLCCSLFILQVLSGTALISFYSAVIFKDVAVSPEYLAIIYQVKQNFNHCK